VISSLLDLQAEKFSDEKVIEAFRESQNRVISMALIHEELYEGEGTDTLNFSEYIKHRFSSAVYIPPKTHNFLSKSDKQYCFLKNMSL
jgi:two-component sensor histidine kinase